MTTHVRACKPKHFKDHTHPVDPKTLLERDTVKKTKQLIRTIFDARCSQELHRKYGHGNRHQLIESMTNLERLPQKFIVKYLARAIESPLLSKEDRSSIIQRFLDIGPLSPIYLGRVVCVAVKHLDRRLVEELLLKGRIPEENKGSTENGVSIPDSWLEAVDLALRNDAKSILEVLVGCKNISDRTRCMAFDHIFHNGYRNQLERLIDLVPQSEKFRQRLIDYAENNRVTDMYEELAANRVSLAI